MASLSSKLKLIVYCEGYEMRHGKPNSIKTVQYWKCLKKHCNGRAKSIFGAEENLVQTQPHRCRRSGSNIQYRQQIARIKSEAVQSYTMPCANVILNGKDGITDEELLRLPHDSALQRMVQRIRKPVGARSVDRPTREIQWLDPFTQTKHGHRFLLIYSRRVQPLQEPFFIYLSDFGLQFLTQNIRWSIDRTFFCAPKHFYQLYTINAFVGNTTLPAAYCLLPNKTEAVYKRMFTALRDCDFELAPINAIIQVLGELNVDFCLFHISKNAFSNIQQKGLLGAYKNLEAKVLLRSLVALALLPITEVSDGFDEVTAELYELSLFQELSLSQKLADFLDYFEKTYIRRHVGGRAKDGLFAASKWNCHNAAIAGIPRTNNAIEGWHYSFNKRFPKSKMLLSQFIVRLQSEEKTRARVNPAEALRQIRRPSIVKRKENIKLLASGYNAGSRNQSRLEYLIAIQSHLARFSYAQEKIGNTNLTDDEHSSDENDDNEN